MCSKNLKKLQTVKKSIRTGLVLVFTFLMGMLYTSTSFGQENPTYEIYITNEQQIDPMTYQFDVYLLSTGSVQLELAGFQAGISYDLSVLNGGTATGQIVPGTSDLTNTSQIPTNLTVGLATYTIDGRTVRFFNILGKIPPGAGNGSIISTVKNGCTAPGTRISTFRLVNSVPFAENSQMNHEFSTAPNVQKTNTGVTAYVNGVNTNVTMYTGLKGYDVPGTCLTNIVLNPSVSCNVSGTADNISYDCLTGTGSASISISGDGSDASGTYSLDGGEAVAFSTNPFTITGLTPGAHTVVTTTGECTSSDINFAVNAPAALNATYTVTDRTRCSGSWDGAIALEVTGGSGNYNYSWSGVIGSGNPATTPAPDLGNTPNPTGLQYGFYNVTVTDAEGCGSVAINDIHVQWAFPPIIQTDGSNSASCNASGTIVVYASAAVPPYMYALDEGTPQASNLFTGVSAGEHTVTVTDAGGCETSQSVTVASSPALGLTYYAYPASSCSDDGAVSLFRSGGIPPIEYSIDGGPYVGTGNYFTGLAAGEHSATVRDSKGCTFTTSFTIAQGAGLTVTTRHSDASTCINDGSIQVVVSGGVAPYTYSLDGGAAQGSASFNDLAAGNYVVTVTDARGCTGTANATVSTNYINVTFEKGDAPDCGGTGWIRLYRTGGSGPFTYSLDGNNYAPSNVFTGIAPGTYTGYIKDSKTCVGQTTENAIIIGPADCNQGTRQAKPISEDLASVNAYPNPSMNEFNLQLKGFNMNEKVSITVTDLLGRKVYQTEGIGKRFYQFGNHFFAGMYNVTIIQGKKMFSVKVVKE